MIEISDFAAAVFGASSVLGATFVVDLLIPDWLERRRPPRLLPEDVRPLTDRLSALARDLDEQGHRDLARTLGAVTLDALNLERKARGAQPLEAPKQLPLLRTIPLVPASVTTSDTSAQTRLWSVLR